MDGISPITAPLYVPQYSGTSTVSSPAPAAADSVTLSSGDASANANVYSAPDPAFAALLQADPALAQDYAQESQFGFTDPVLAYDDTLGSTTHAGTTASATPAADPATVANQVALSALNFNNSVASALLGSTSTFFTGASMANLLNTTGTAALAYLTPQAAQASGSVDAIA